MHILLTVLVFICAVSLITSSIPDLLRHLDERKHRKLYYEKNRREEFSKNFSILIEERCFKDEVAKKGGYQPKYYSLLNIDPDFFIMDKKRKYTHGEVLNIIRFVRDKIDELTEN